MLSISFLYGLYKLSLYKPYKKLIGRGLSAYKHIEIQSTFRAMNTVINERWEKYRHLLNLAEVPAKTVLLREGEVSKKAYFIEKRCLRLWYNSNGKDITEKRFAELK